MSASLSSEPLIQSAVANRSRQRIKRAFARSAATYDKHALLQRQVADYLLSKIPLNAFAKMATQHLVDLGAGTGYCTHYLQQRNPNANLLAVDLAEPMLHATAKRVNAFGSADTTVQGKIVNNEVVNQVQLLCADAQMLPLQTSSVDLLVSSLAVQWCSQLSQVFSELARVLRPGKHAWLSTFGPATLQELRTALHQVQPNYRANTFVQEEILLQFATAVGLHATVERQVIVQHYLSLHELMVELRGLGASTVLESSVNQPLTPRRFQQLSEHFAAHAKADVGIPVSWEIFYLQLHKPEA